MSLHIGTPDISQGQNCQKDKICQTGHLCHQGHFLNKNKNSLCILLHPIYHKDKTGVVYSKWCSIALCLCILVHLIYHKDKTVKRTKYARLAIFVTKAISLIRTKTVFAYCCIRYITRTKLVLCIQNSFELGRNNHGRNDSGRNDPGRNDSGPKRPVTNPELINQL